MTYGKYGTADCSHRTVSDTGGRLLVGKDVESCGLPIVEEGLGLKGSWKPIPENCWADSVFCIFSMEKLLGDLSKTWSHSVIQIVCTLLWFYAADLWGIKSYRAVWESCTSTMCFCKKLQRGTVWHLGGLLQSLNQGKLGCPQLAFDASWLKHHLNNCHDATSKDMRSRSVWQGQW